MTPAETLRAAAAMLRDTASNATPGPWSASAVWSPRSHATSAVYSRAHATGTHAPEVIPSMLATRKRPLVRPGDAVWIALMHPGLAEPLAAWLEGCANDLEVATRSVARAIPYEPDLDPIEVVDEPASVGHALAVARAILGRSS